MIEQEPEMESIEGFGDSIVSAARLLVAERGMVARARSAFRELDAALDQWRAWVS